MDAPEKDSQPSRASSSLRAHHSLPPKPIMMHALPPRPVTTPASDMALRIAELGRESRPSSKQGKPNPRTPAWSGRGSPAQSEASQARSPSRPSVSEDKLSIPSKRKHEDMAIAAGDKEGPASATAAVIPILPTPLPSKRFKKGAQSKALLIPVEQLPVYALPPLPVITDPDLLTQVFNHQSLFGRQRRRFEDPDDSPSMHYEKLEHVGDSILGMIVTTWLQETKPGLTCGTASKLKSHLVSNATLSHISGLYNLPSRLKGDPNQLPVLRAQTDVRAAMVEAYIAALYFSSPAKKRMTEALPMIDSWLRDMYEPLYDFFFTYMKAEYDQHRNAIGENPDGTVQTISDQEMKRIDDASAGMAALLKAYGNRQDRMVEYTEERYDTNLGILWRVIVCVDGVELGEATRADKKVAKNVAAWEAAKLLGLAGLNGGVDDQ